MDEREKADMMAVVERKMEDVERIDLAWDVDER
jgi:hypothetical protein